VPDFFIARNKADKAWAVWIAWQLEDAGYSTVVQDWDFRPGSNFVLKMQDATTNATRTIAVLSPSFLKSEYTAPEWAAAFAGDPTGAKRKLVPVRVRPCKPTGLLAPISYIDLVDLDVTDAKGGLLRGVKQSRAKPSTPPAFPGIVRAQQPPFPGKRAQRTPLTQGSTRSTPQAPTAAEIAARIDRHQWGVRPDRGRGGWTGDVWFGAVIIPEWQGAPYLDVLKLGRPDLQDQIQGLALVGPSAVFRATRGTKVAEREDHLVLEQHDDHARKPVAALEVHTDGTLVYRTAVERKDTRAIWSMAEPHVINEDFVRGAIASFVAFASRFYKQRRRATGNFYLGLSLSDIAHKHFGQLPNYEIHSFTMGDPRINDPLRVPSAPLKITSAQLAKPDIVAKTAVEHIARVFRLAGAYYIP